MDQRIASNFIGKTRAAITQDATLAVKQNQITNRDRLLVVTLLFDVTTFAGTVAERLILQRAFATLVAHWTIKWVIRQQQFDDAFLSALHLIGLGAHNLSFSNGGHATDHHHWPTRTFNFNQTLTTHADSTHTWVITETRNVIATAIGSSNNQFAFTSGNGFAVD